MCLVCDHTKHDNMKALSQKTQAVCYTEHNNTSGQKSVRTAQANSKSHAHRTRLESTENERTNIQSMNVRILTQNQNQTRPKCRDQKNTLRTQNNSRGRRSTLTLRTQTLKHLSTSVQAFLCCLHTFFSMLLE